MRIFALALVVVLLAACKKGSLDKLLEPPKPESEQATVYVARKHPLYVILETPPRNQYENELPKMLAKVINVDALQQFCGQWYPDSGRAVADAYVAWRKRHESTIQELTRRSEAVWSEYAGEDEEYVRLVYPHLRKEMRKGIDAEFDRSPAEKFRRICAQFPADLASARWDLDKTWSQELAYLRQTPMPPTPPATVKN
jgi:hypothetical protein